MSLSWDGCDVSGLRCFESLLLIGHRIGGLVVVWDACQKGLMASECWVLSGVLEVPWQNSGTVVGTIAKVMPVAAAPRYHSEEIPRAATKCPSTLAQAYNLDLW